MTSQAKPEFDWGAFAARCLKPDPHRLGTWTARRWGRPLALRVTRVVAPWGFSANSATIAACLVAFLACIAFCMGELSGLTVGCMLLHVWYLLDHVDGQLARLQGTASLDGTALDYLMHHGVQLFVPQAVCFGLFCNTAVTVWLFAGAAWGGGALMLGLRHDVRYKAFIQRLKLLHGELRLVGGGGGRPEPAKLPGRAWLQVFRWCLMKCYETHIVLMSLSVIVAAAWAMDGAWAPALSAYVAAMALPAPCVALYLVARTIRQGDAEREFAAWFRVPDDSALELRDGWWYVAPIEDAIQRPHRTNIGLPASPASCDGLS